MSKELEKDDEKQGFKFTEIQMLDIIEKIYSKDFSKDEVCNLLFKGRVKK